MKKLLKHPVTDILVIAFGGLVYALSVVVFLNPNNIVPGGVTGIAMVINHVFPFLPIGVLIIVINIPLFIAGAKFEGRPFLIKSVIGTAFSSVFIDLLDGIFYYTEDQILATLYGGILMGLGLGIIFTRGATTGGSDIVSRLFKRKFPHVSMGRMMLVLDLIVISFAAAVFGHFSFALYAIVGIYVSSLVIDKVLYGFDLDKVAFIITALPSEVFSAIDDELDRGATILHGEGAYSGKPTKVIMCAIKVRQIAQFKDLVRNVDPNSFVIISDAREVLGDGFRDHNAKTF